MHQYAQAYLMWCPLCLKGVLGETFLQMVPEVHHHRRGSSLALRMPVNEVMQVMGMIRVWE